MTPVVLFAFARPVHLARVLDCLRANQVPRIIAYCDAPRSLKESVLTSQVGALLSRIDWSDVEVRTRSVNFGLGRSVLEGVTEVAKSETEFIVWEDDLICVPGTYLWLCAALKAYEKDSKVGSISAWTHPRVTPVINGDEPYFDSRAECWVWGSWSRAWTGMIEESALLKMRQAEARGVARDAYGTDLPAMARDEERKNVWAVRWLYHHMMHNLLCLRPPWSMVEHIGTDSSASNAAAAEEWRNPPLATCPPVPTYWPSPLENPECRALWREAAKKEPICRKVLRRLGL